MSVIIKLLSKFDNSGIKKAQSGFSGLGKTLGAIGIGFGIKQITDGLLDAAKAAAADEKSTRLLNTQLARNAGATKEQLKQNDAFIESLSLQTGIMDDDLRPAMSRFGNVTGNVKDAQKLLKITLDAAAGSGLSQTKISKAVSQAYAGNTKSLQRMFPELRKSKDVLGDFAKTYEGLAVANADPFMKFNNSMDILKEKLGVIVLPLIIDTIEKISQPGGLIETVGKFFEDVANPKTDVGKTFEEIKTAVGEVVKGVGDFFAFFGDGNAVTGFKNIATSLIQALPALLALKGIMTLASGGKAIASLVTAITMIKGGTPPGGIPPVVTGLATNPLVIGAVASQAGTLAAATAAQDVTNKEAAKKGMQFNIVSATFTGSMALPRPMNPQPGDLLGLRGNRPTTINVYNTAVDPKASVDSLMKYVKTNGSLPAQLFWNQR
jgi:hypothetical protein